MVSDGNFDTKDFFGLWKEASNDVFRCSLLSLCSSVCLLCHYYKVPSVRRTPGWLLLRANLCEVLVSFLFMLSYYQTKKKPDEVRSGVYRQEEILLFCVASAEVGANAWRVLMFLHLMVIYRNPFSPDRHRVLYVCFVMCCAMITPLFIVGVQRDGWRVQHIFIFAFGLYFLPFSLFVVLGGVLHAIVSWMIQDSQRGGRPASITFLARQNAMRHSSAYLILHGTQLAIGLAIVVVLLVKRSPSNFAPFMAFWHILVHLTCSRPCISTLAWMLVNGCIKDTAHVTVEAVVAAKRRLTLERVPEQKHEPGSGVMELSTRPLSLADESLVAMTGQPSRVWAISNMESGFKKELRFELLYDVACSIGELAQQELRQDPEADESVAAMSMIVMPSQTKAAGALTRKELRGLKDREGRGTKVATRHHHLRGVGLLESDDMTSSYVSSSPSSARSEHYEADSFRKIREAFGITTVTYARAFPNDLSEADPNWQRRLKESVSEGASGSFFYRVMGRATADGPSLFIVKQINVREKHTLMKILPAYQKHVVERGGRSLIRYFSCHSLNLRWKFSAKVFFVVMRNFLPVQSWLIFDLKGATANRRALKSKSLHRKDVNARQTAHGTLRDWEWMDIAMGVDVSEEDKTALHEMIAEDARFLAEQGLLDYSLLIGIHRLPKDLSPADREAKLESMRDLGGYPSLDHQKVYFFGIIDVLERYTPGWWGQHLALKSAYSLTGNCDKADGISAMPPNEYADRFYTFVAQEVLQMPVGTVSLESDSRWGLLWQRRRRGLVTERIQTEREDYTRRIAELEQELRTLRGDPTPPAARPWTREAPAETPSAPAKDTEACSERGIVAQPRGSI